MILGRRALLAGASLTATWPAWGQAAATADVPVQVAAAPDITASSGSIEEQMQAYIDESGFTARERAGEIAILRGSGIVEAMSTDPKWVAFRSLAYERALLEAQADYVLQQNAQITAETVSTLFKAADREPPPYKPADNDPTKVAELVRKLVALGSGKLDKELRDLGINPSEYERAADPQRYVQMRSALMSKSMERAFGDLVGLTPVQTFEARLGSGDTAKGAPYKIGVFAVVSPKMKDFAQRVLKERGQFPPEPAKAAKLSDLYADKARLVHDFGVRWRYDENGLPVIVSFSQWMSDYRGQDPITAERYRETAHKQAELRADAQIADFLKGSVNVERTADVGQTFDEGANRMPDGYVEQQAEVRKLLSAYQSNIRRRSQVSVTGLTTLSRWSGKHPDNGQEILGVVRIWSAAAEQQTRALRDGRPPAVPAVAGRPTGPGPVQTGRKLMDANDF